jgi:hypothetical protein
MLEAKIKDDYIQAMKAKDSVRSATLSFVRAQLKNYQITQQLDVLEDSHVIAVLKKQAKQRQDSIKQFQDGGRADLAEKEQKELAIIEEYLPEPMSEGELSSIITSVIAEVGAKSMKDMGRVMKQVIEKTDGRADNKTVSILVKQALN